MFLQVSYAEANTNMKDLVSSLSNNSWYSISSLFLFFFLWWTSVPVAFDRLPLHGAGPRGHPSPRIFMFLGRMKTAFVPSPSPGPWRARRLNSADVDSRVWLALTQTHLCGSLHGLKTFWTQGLNWIQSGPEPSILDDLCLPKWNWNILAKLRFGTSAFQPELKCLENIGSFFWIPLGQGFANTRWVVFVQFHSMVFRCIKSTNEASIIYTKKIDNISNIFLQWWLSG